MSNGQTGTGGQNGARFIEAAQRRLHALSTRHSRAKWVHSTYITQDTEVLAAEADRDLIAASVGLALEARRFDGETLDEDVARCLVLLKRGLTSPAPTDPASQQELAELAASLQGDYGRGRHCPPDRECLDLGALSRVMDECREPERLLEAWTGWHAIGAPMRRRYERFVHLAHEGARTLGYADLGVLWRSGYDLPPDEFADEVERLWQEVRPLYDSLHRYVRMKLVEAYGADVVDPEGPIPAHLLGNMWAQEWKNIYPMVAPPGADPGYDLTALIVQAGLDARAMVRSGERFFTSLGFEALPATFWERSLFTKPADRDVVCHASAWNLDDDLDLRIKMCITPTAEDFTTIHHELGHTFYQRAYRHQPYLFREGANDGFHEAIGDAIALSVTPEYLVHIGLLDRAPGSDSDIGLLLRRALDKVAFLPFGLSMDRWRWKVFSGEIGSADYNRTWWEIRREYQGIVPPVTRTEADFDPGAKYHIPANVPYTRYFLAAILQYQFHRALCREAGLAGPLHRASIFGSRQAGRRLEAMLAMGASRPWPDALEALTGERQMDASALLDYYAPLKAWLDEQVSSAQAV